MAYDRIPGWDERAAATYRGILEHREVVAAVAGEGVIFEAEWVQHTHTTVFTSSSSASLRRELMPT